MGNSTRRAFPPWTRACASHTYCTPLDVHNRQGLPSMRRGRSVGKADVRNDSGRDARPRGGREARPDPAARGPKQKLALPLGAKARTRGTARSVLRLGEKAVSATAANAPWGSRAFTTNEMVKLGARRLGATVCGACR